MKILKFRGKSVHGIFDYDVNFNKRLTFLTGDNGSGKTTILNAIEALLMPRLDYLVLHKFETLELEFHKNKKKINLEARGGDECVTITCSKFPKEEFVINRKIVSEFLLFELDSRSNREGIVKRFQRYVLDRMRDNQIYEYICSLPTPTYLGLERKELFATQNFNPIEVEESEIIYSKMLGFQLEDELSTAVHYAQSAITKCFMDRNRVDRERLRRLMSFVLPPVVRERNSSMDGEISFDELESLYDKLSRLSKHVSNFVGMRGSALRILADYVSDHLKSIKNIREYAKKNKKKNISFRDKQIDAFIIGSHFIKNIDKILDIAGDYDNKINVLFNNVDGFVNTINKFFRISNSKKILNYNDRGKLLYKFTDSSNVLYTLSTKTLSSGERQMIILFANLYFNPIADKINVFCIDEPEMSLHVLWQQELANAMLEASKRNQMIMATHSPLIFMHRVDNCEAVIPEFHEKKNDRK